ncbi:MAG: hypothetical protein ABJE95_01420 [Byssovorax sp.]
MATNTDRDIDWEIARLSGGLTAARRAVPAHQGSLRPSDWDLAEREEGPLSERGEALRQDLEAIEARKRPIVESIAPMSMETEAPAAAQSEPPDARKRHNRGENAFWTGTAAAMSVLAIGLVVGLGLSPVPHAATPAAAAPAPASMAVVPEGVPAVTRPMVMLDPVFLTADPPAAAPIHAAPVVAAPAARAAVAPAPAATAPQMVIPPLAAAPPVAGVDISRPAVAVAISVAGRRAASCTADDDARSTMPVSVTFAPSGRVTTATVDGGPFVGTAVGGCIARALRGATVARFDGAPVTVHSSVRIR